MRKKLLSLFYTQYTNMQPASGYSILRPAFSLLKATKLTVCAKANQLIRTKRIYCKAHLRIAKPLRLQRYRLIDCATTLNFNTRRFFGTQPKVSYTNNVSRSEKTRGGGGWRYDFATI